MASDGDGPDRDESEDEKADRRYDELLQELRVAQTGVQFLFAFLLTLAFTQRFPQINDLQLTLYVVTLVTTAVAAALLIGPVPFHRIVFRRGLKPRLVAGADLMARGGLIMLLVAINSAVLLILDVALGGVLPFVISGAIVVWFVVIWYVMPVTARERSRS